MRVSFFLWVAFVVATYFAGNASAERSVAIELSPDFPRDLPVLVPATVSGRAGGSSSLEVALPMEKDKGLIGQTEAETDRVWFALNAANAFTGKSLRLKARPVKADTRVTVREEESGFEFVDADRPVLFYQRDPVTQHKHTRAGYVHPLRGLDGETFTEAFPSDHRHHQGVFWAWHQLWVGDRKVGDPWITKDHLVVAKEARVVEQGPVFATLDVVAHWTSPQLTDESGRLQPIVEERTRIRLFRQVGNVRYVDFTIQLTPQMPDVKIGGSENVKGYSGFTVRVKPPKDMKIHDANGLLSGDNVQTPSAWAGVSGRFSGRKTSGVAILSHPSLPQFPPRWLLRHYGMQNVAYPGRKPISLSAEKPLVLRHRLVLHRGSTKRARIPDHQQVYEFVP